MDEKTKWMKDAEERVWHYLHLEDGGFDGNMKASFAGCDYEEQSITFAFETQHWQINERGGIHGGAIAGMFDTAFGIMNVSGDLMALMPKEISVPQLPYAEELNQAMKDQGIEDMPDLTSMQTIKINMADATSGNSEYQIPDSLLKQLQESDVTTITASVKDMRLYR
jgi:hypothetical protein